MAAQEDSTGSATEEFRARLHESPRKPLEIARFLDGLSHDERVGATRSLDRAQQRALYKMADGFAPLTLAEMVPPEVATLEPVRHYGKNSLPLFSQFEKRFCRASEVDPNAPAWLLGYNFQTLSPLTGPGYFVAREDTERGEVVIDYRELPPEKPPHWPAIQPNDRGLSQFIYGNMVDTLRRVSQHVTIGSAARGGKDLGSWFVLCRES